MPLLLLHFLHALRTPTPSLPLLITLAPPCLCNPLSHLLLLDLELVLCVSPLHTLLACLQLLSPQPGRLALSRVLLGLLLLYALVQLSPGCVCPGCGAWGGR